MGSLKKCKHIQSAEAFPISAWAKVISYEATTLHLQLLVKLFADRCKGILFSLLTSAPAEALHLNMKLKHSLFCRVTFWALSCFWASFLHCRWR